MAREHPNQELVISFRVVSYESEQVLLAAGYGPDSVEIALSRAQYLSLREDSSLKLEIQALREVELRSRLYFLGSIRNRHPKDMTARAKALAKALGSYSSQFLTKPLNDFKDV